MDITKALSFEVLQISSAEKPKFNTKNTKETLLQIVFFFTTAK